MDVGHATNIVAQKYDFEEIKHTNRVRQCVYFAVDL